jgi:phosphate uptake regulator
VERHFEQELEQLRNELLAMSALAESAVYRSITAVVQKDRKLAEEKITIREAGQTGRLGKKGPLRKLKAPDAIG